MRQAVSIQPDLTEKWLDLDHAKELEAISRLLDRDPRIYELAWQDLQLQAGGKGQSTGARGMSGEQVVRALIVKQMGGFSYSELAFHLEDSRSYRTFCRLGLVGWTPKKSTLAQNIKALTCATLEAIHKRIVALALDTGVERGNRVRVDATVVESNIHHPTDSELLWDCVRVLTRLLARARGLLGSEHFSFRDRSRQAKRRRKKINDPRTKDMRLQPYRDLIQITEKVQDSAKAARNVLAKQGPSQESGARGLLEELDCFLERTATVIDPTRRRILDGETVPASEKIVSIFEEHTAIIRKDARETLYGHKVCLTAGSSSLVLDLVILQGNPPDSSLATTMVQRHIANHSQPPRQIAFDGGFASKANLEEIKQMGVHDVVFSKGRGLQVSDMAQSSWVYKRLRDFRAGIEGIISFLKRAFGLKRCTWRSWPSFQSYAWASVITSNLLVTARHLIN